MHKTFAFFLLAFAFLMASCHFNPSVQGNGVNYLQGEWKQDSVHNGQQLVGYSLYHFTFNCDSFFVRMENFSKVNYGADTCMKSGHWFEYAKGTYDKRSDSLHLKGFYCHANYSLKDPGGCFTTGVYEDYFKMKAHTDSLLSLLPLNNNTIPLNLKLIKRLSCVPKAL
jgi:hypothetical protein